MDDYEDYDDAYGDGYNRGFGNSEDDDEEIISLEDRGQSFLDYDEDIPETHTEEMAGLESTNEIETGLVSMGGKYLDPIDKYVGLMNTRLTSLNVKDDTKTAAIKIIRKNNLMTSSVVFMNVDLLSIAILFHSRYTGGINKVNDKNIGDFVKQHRQQNPLDIIRYIKVWEAMLKI